MTGQDAVKSADEFHKRLGITGVILTKMDGDARGGAALSIRHVTGQPLKFVGVGREVRRAGAVPSRPRGQPHPGHGRHPLASSRRPSEAIDQKKAVEMQRKLIENEFTLEDFRDQLRQIRKLGPLGSLLDMMPKVGMLKELKDVKVDEKEIDRVVAIIDSMTPRERDNHMIINGSRRRRIARGSGTSRAGSQPVVEAVRAGPQDDEEPLRRLHGQEVGQDEDARRLSVWGATGVAELRPQSATPTVLIFNIGVQMLMIRLARFGAKKKPFYRVVVIEKERARNGRSLEVVGHYNPLTNPAQVVLKHDRIEHWTKNGAQMSDTVKRLVEKNPRRRRSPAA